MNFLGKKMRKPGKSIANSTYPCQATFVAFSFSVQPSDFFIMSFRDKQFKTYHMFLSEMQNLRDHPTPIEPEAALSHDSGRFVCTVNSGKYCSSAIVHSII